MKLIPNGWRELQPLGAKVPGTPFLPFKVPLKEDICSRVRLAECEWFTPKILLSIEPRLKMIIDLTKTTRYYDKKNFIKHGIRYAKLACEGRGVLPPPSIIQRFYSLVDEFMGCQENIDNEAVIGVHCTHGLNRTGYLICKYMITRMNVQPGEAIELFQRARGHTIERDLYIRDILNGSSIHSIQSNSSISDPVSRPPHTSNHRGHRQPQSSNWRERPYSNNFNREPNRPFLKPKFNRDVDIHKRHRFVAPPLDGGGRFVPTQEQQSGSRPRPYVIPPRRREIYKYQGRY